MPLENTQVLSTKVSIKELIKIQQQQNKPKLSEIKWYGQTFKIYSW